MEDSIGLENSDLDQARVRTEGDAVLIGDLSHALKAPLPQWGEGRRI